MEIDNTTPAPKPIRIAPSGVTKPQAGVTATRPATAPAAAPSTLGLPLRHQCTVIQVSAPTAAARFVATNALAARPPAESAEPALKPNQPNQTSAAPSTTIVMLCGSVVASGATPMRRPRT